MIKVKKYNSSWEAEKLEINFNQKQWRQDLAAYIRNKKYWHQARVSRSKTVEARTTYNSSVKEFKVYDGYGGDIVVRYTNKNEIIYTSNEEILLMYFKSRAFNQ